MAVFETVGREFESLRRLHYNISIFMSIDYLFSVPVFCVDIIGEDFDNIQKEIATSVEDLKDKELYHPLDGNVTTSYDDKVTNDYLDRYNMESFKRITLSHVESYRNSVNYYTNYNIDYNIKGWITYYYKNNFQFDHDHGLNGIAGVYYYKTNGDDGNIIFEHPTSSFVHSNFPFTPKDKMAVYRPKVGRLILFPQWLTHRVTMNRTENTRISVAFNVDFIFKNKS